MSGNSTTSSNQTSYRQQYSNDKIASTSSNNNTKTTSTQAYRQQPSGSDYWTSTSTSSNDTQSTAMSSTTSSRSVASSTRGSSSIDSQKRPLIDSHRKSSMERAMDKAKGKLGRSPSGAEVLPNDELDYERQRAKAAEKQRRKEEYERLGLGDKTKFGQPGGVSFNG